MSRKIAWFSSGAASAVAAAISNPDVIAYIDVGSEDEDNHRFLLDCEKWFGKDITILKSDEFEDTWQVWESRKYISGINGAPCTSILKRQVRESFQRPGDVHIFGYTADSRDIMRFEALQENYPDLIVEAPLIEKGLTKEACLAILESKGIKLPRVYAFGFPNANCLPCCKATSPAYWALVRQCFPEQFSRMAELSRRLNCRLTRINGERAFIDEIPLDHPVSDAIAPACDMLCQITLDEISRGNPS